VSPGAATDGVTQFSPKNDDDLFAEKLKSDELFCYHLLLTTSTLSAF